MKKIWVFLIGFITGVSIILVIGLCLRKTPNELPNEIIAKQQYTIDSLRNCINSIESKVDTLYIEKTKIIYKYEKKADDIWDQSADDDWDYYKNFLRSRFPNNCDTTKAN